MRRDRPPEVTAAGRLFVLALGLVVVAALALLGPHSGLADSWRPFLGILAVATAAELVSVPLPGYGMLGLGFFVYFAALCRTPRLYSPEFQQATGLDLVIAVSQALLAAFAALLLRAVLAEGPRWHRAADLFINLLRVWVVGLAYLVVAWQLPPGPYDLFSVYSLAGLVAAAAAYWLVDLWLSGTAVGLLAEESRRARWWEVYQRFGFKIGVLLVTLGFLAVVAADAAAQRAGLGATASLAGGLLLAFLPALGLRSAFFFWVHEPEQRRKEERLVELQASLAEERRKVHAMGLREEGLSRDLQKKGADLEMLYGMARDLGASTDLQETLDIVLRMIHRMEIPYQSCAIFLLREGRPFPAKSITPYQEVLDMAALLALEEAVVNEVIRTRRPRLVNDYRPTSEQRIFKNEHSVLCVPMVVSKEVIGALYVGARDEGVYTDDHLHTLTMLAAHAAPSIKTAELFEVKEEDLIQERLARAQVEERHRVLSGLQRMGQAMGRDLQRVNTFEVVSAGIREMIPDVQSIIFLLQKGEDEHELEALWTDTPYADFVRTAPFRKDEGLLGEAIGLSSTLLLHDARESPQPNDVIANERSVIVAPLEASDEVLGCLYVGAAKEGTFTEDHRSLIETISYQAALALKNAQLYEQTRQQALTDGLTGLFTHRYFQVQLEEEIKMARRNKTPLCLVFVDTDHFKTFNDTLGHPAGDTLLREIASLLRESVRASDIVCRYGGDEFALILKDSSKENAARIAEDIRSTFELRFAGQEVKVTSSIGVACFPSDAQDRKQLVQAADEALYLSKRGGRNRVSLAPTLEQRASQEPVEITPLPR